MTVRVLQGDCRNVLKTLPETSVHCVVTSPPYFGLRDYGVQGQIGLEESPQAFVDALVGVFQDVRRVLRDDGTAWVNIGDTYAGSWGAPGRQGKNGQMADRSVVQARSIDAHPQRQSNTGTIRHPGVKAKDLYGIPWMLAFALRADGWWLRQDIIWAKPNPMPESVTDRCTKAHEYIFLLAKSAHYYYDRDAIREPNAEPKGSGGWQSKQRRKEQFDSDYERKKHAPERADKDGLQNWQRDYDGRNKRSVWTINTAPFDEAHFATFPPSLIEPCILAGCPEGGTVLDPFGGAGTTGLVADRLKRDAILIELNHEYAEMARKRIYNDSPLFADVLPT